MNTPKIPATTRHHEFMYLDDLPRDVPAMALFAVRVGVPLENAQELADSFLDTANSLLAHMSAGFNNKEPGLADAARWLSEMGNAVYRSLLSGSAGFHCSTK